MNFTEDTAPSGVDPLANANENIERVEHAPQVGEDNKKQAETNEDDGRIYLWLSCLVGVVGIAIIIFVILVFGGDDDDGKSSPAIPVPAATWPPFPVVDDTQAQLDMIRKAVGLEEVTKGLLEVLPITVADLQGKADDATADAVVRAAAWVVLEDTYNAENQIVERFALATLYFATGGDDWTLNYQWLDDESFCDAWYGVTCCGHLAEGTSARCHGKHPDSVAYLDLSDNNLEGPFPVTFALLDDLQLLMLGWNKLSGPLDSEIIASMAELSSLQIQFNRFSGPIIDERALDNGKFHALYLQGNYFEGDWPEGFCNTLGSWNFDCDRHHCTTSSCCRVNASTKECTYLSHVIDDSDLENEEGPFGG